MVQCAKARYLVFWRMYRLSAVGETGKLVIGLIIDDSFNWMLVSVLMLDLEVEATSSYP